MKSPLELDNAVVKEFGITPEVDQDLVFKLAYVRSQKEEIKKMLWRERVDLILAENQVNSDIELIADKGRQLKTEKRNNIRQIVGSLERLMVLEDELSAVSDAK